MKSGLPDKITEVREMERLITRIRNGAVPKPERGKEKVIYDPKLPGFGIRLLYTGGATWFARYHLNGKELKKSLGDVRAIDRDVAFKAASDLRAKVQLGRLDPQEARREARRAGQVTFESVVPRFLEYKKTHKHPKRKRIIRSGTWERYKLYLEGYYLKPLHKLPLIDITKGQIHTCYDHVKEVSGDDTAHQCHSLVNDLYNWAYKYDVLPDDHPNPMTKVEKPPKSDKRDRVLSDDEIQRIWKTCDDWEAETINFRQKGLKRSPGGFVVIPDYARAVQLLFLTGLRAQEIGDLHWSEVHLDLDPPELLIVGQRTKNGKPICIPLANMAADILRKVKAETKTARPDDPVFGRGDGETVIRDGLKWKNGLSLGDTVAKIVKRFKRGQAGFWEHMRDPAKIKRIRYALASHSISTRQIMKQEEIAWRTLKAVEKSMKDGEPIPEAQPEMPHWRMHDIRRTMRTGLSRCGVSRDIAERLISHKPVDITETEEAYDLHEYWSQKTDAVKKWQDRLRTIIDGTAQEIPRSKSNRKAA